MPLIGEWSQYVNVDGDQIHVTQFQVANTASRIFPNGLFIIIHTFTVVFTTVYTNRYMIS